MDDTILYNWFYVIVAMTVVIYVLTMWLLRRLRSRHAETYKAIGSPSVFFTSPKGSYEAYIKFIFNAQWRELDDPSLTNMCQIIRIAFVIYLLLFFGLLLCFAYAFVLLIFEP